MVREATARSQWSQLKANALLRPWLAADEERELLKRAQEGDRQAVRALVDSHMRLVMQIASRYERDGLSVHDLVSEGVVGLIEAIGRFDMSHQTRLSTYASWWVRARIREFAFENRRTVPIPSTRAARVARARLNVVRRKLSQELGREPSHAELAVAIGVAESDVATVATALSAHDVSLSPDADGFAFEPADDRINPEQAVAERESERVLRRALSTALDTLSERDRKIVHEQFLAEDLKSMAELGRSLGVSRQCVCQIFARLRKKLGRELKHVAC